MSSLWLTWRLLRARGVSHGLTIVILVLGMGLMTATAATADAARAAFSAMAARFPLVVGSEIGAVPLVLGSLTRLQDLGAGVEEQVLLDLESDPRVERVVPLLAGHAVQGHALLATSPEYLQPRERFPLADGRIFEPGAMEVVLGSEAAQGLGLGLGDAVVIEHQHAGAPVDPGQLAVVGVLLPTRSDADRSLFCPLEAIFHSHEAHHSEAHQHDQEALHSQAHQHEHEAHDSEAHQHEHEHGGHHHHARRLSALLISPTDDSALLSLQEELDALPGIQVALTGQTLRRIADQVATGGRLLQILVSGVVLITFLSLLLSVYGTTLAQAREMAIMRVLGARRVQVVGVMLGVTLAVIVCGSVLGLGVGHLLGQAAELTLRGQMGLEAHVSLLSPTVLVYLGIAASLLAVVGVQPALAAYTVQAAEALAELPGSGHTTNAWLRWSMRFLLPLAVFVWAQQAMMQHGAESVPVPLDPESQALFQELAVGDADGPHLQALDGQEITVQGYMYALGDPFTVHDFHLVALNPRLPRCPFCYRAPTRWERIHVQNEGSDLDLAPGLVRVSGTLHLDPAGDNPIWMAMEHFEVVIP